MGRPQQPELNRSGTTPLQPDSLESEVKARHQKRPGQGDDAKGAVPEANQRGHHPEHEQDKPDPEAFVRRFGRGGGGPTTGRRGAGTATDAPTRKPDRQVRRSPVGPLARDLLDRVRRRDVIGLVTFPLRAGLRLVWHYQPFTGAPRG